MRGLHVQQALAGERAFAEDVLVDLGAGRAVGVDAGLAGEQPVVRRQLLRRRQRGHQMRLQDAVAALHAAAVGAELRRILRVRGHAHQFAQAARRQMRVAVQRHQVGGAGRHVGELAKVDERLPRHAGQRGDELFELAALAFPADPAAFGGAILALAVQQQEARRGTG
ncbi:MAG: hypothetical protein U5L05_03510 [Rubrivivax sp.]|nr:hypothetical protein [Rubrivivax sp.]